MKFLLDTHALLWWLADDNRLGPTARAIIEDPANDILVSVVSLWKIVVKVRAGKLTVSIDEITDAIPRSGFTSLDIRPAHLTTLMGFPMHHRDPLRSYLDRTDDCRGRDVHYEQPTRGTLSYPDRSLLR